MQVKWLLCKGLRKTDGALMPTALSLFRSSGFLPLFIVQFGGALNDNLFKSAILILIAFQLTDAASQAGVINNLAALLFILPYFFLSPLAGQLADRYHKAAMMQKNKVAEILIALAAAGALFSQSIASMLFVLFLLGAQSSMFGPNKYAILPQLLRGKSLIAANALIASGTFIAILTGTLLGGVLAQQSSAWMWVGSACLMTAVIGYLAARQLPETEIGEPDLKLDWNLYRQTKLLIGMARHNRHTWAAIIGVSWFWFTGVAYLTQIPTIVRYIGGGDESVVTLLLALFILGIGFGCAYSTYVSDETPEIGLSPIAIALAGLVGLNLAFIENSPSFEILANAQDFLQGRNGPNILLDIFLIGFLGGAFVLPLYTELQQTTRSVNRARIISINNVLNAFFMVISSLIALLVLGLFKLELSTYLGIVAGLNIVFALYLHAKVAMRTWRFLAEIGSRLVYRIDAVQIDKLPLEGSALIVCNHVSYADPIIIFGASKRPIRFLMDKKIRETRGFYTVLKQARTLGICSPLADRQAYEYAIEQAVQSLKNGELVFIFPEGRLTEDGEIGHFHRGVEKLIEGHPAPVIPMAIQGLWGSFFSHKNGFAFGSDSDSGNRGSKFWNLKFQSFRPEVSLVVGAAISPEDVTAGLLRQKVERLRGDRR